MSIENNTNLNYLLSTWPEGLVITSNSFLQKGYSYQLINKYVKSSWVKKLGQGAYVKLKDVPNIYGVLNALQEQQYLHVHLGGLSSLEYYGLAQYSNLSITSCYYLYATNKTTIKMPRWVNNIDMKIERVNKHLFNSNIGITEKEINGISFKLSKPERAILELLALVTKCFSFQFANDNLENLQLLDDELMQELLENCKSIQVKRLFLYFADEKKLPCFRKLSLNKIDLGSGKRVIGEGGHYIPKYKLSVPRVDFEEGVVDV